MPLKPYYDHAGIRIYHGDCREVLPRLPGLTTISPWLKADAIITDPPYGIGQKYGDSYDDAPGIYWEWFLPCIEKIRASTRMLAFTHRFPESFKRLTNWDWIAVWHKPYSAGARIGNSPVVPHWEPIFLYGIYSLGTRRVAFPDVISVNPEPSRARPVADSLSQIQSPRSKAKAVTPNGHHPLPKPLNLMKILVQRLSDEDSLVCDPFMGSGTTLEAAKALGRRAVGIEVHEPYCEIAAKRLSQEVLEFKP